MEQYRFLARDLAALQQRLERYEVEWRATIGGIHDSTTQSSETWHDNPQFDDVQQRARMLDTERRRLAAVLRDSVQLQPAAPDGSVDIGSTVLIRYNPSGAEEQLVIGSYMVLDGEETRISYATPLAQLLIGHTKGERLTATINNRLVDIEIRDVRVSDDDL